MTPNEPNMGATRILQWYGLMNGNTTEEIFLGGHLTGYITGGCAWSGPNAVPTPKPNPRQGYRAMVPQSGQWAVEIIAHAHAVGTYPPDENYKASNFVGNVGSYYLRTGFIISDDKRTYTGGGGFEDGWSCYSSGWMMTGVDGASGWGGLETDWEGETIPKFSMSVGVSGFNTVQPNNGSGPDPFEDPLFSKPWEWTTWQMCENGTYLVITGHNYYNYPVRFHATAYITHMGPFYEFNCALGQDTDDFCN